MAAEHWSEGPSLEEHHAGGTLELVLEQRPYVGGWHVLVLWSQVITFFAGWFDLTLGFPLLPVFGIGWTAAAFGVHGVGTRVRRPARLTVTPTVLTVTAWTGWLAWPRTVALSLDRVTLEHTRVGNYPRQLTLTDGEHTCTVPGIVCTPTELERVRAVLSAAADHARSVQGEGEAEVPAPLRGFLRATPEGR